LQLASATPLTLECADGNPPGQISVVDGDLVAIRLMHLH